jgi:hypothetical protein
LIGINRNIINNGSKYEKLEKHKYINIKIEYKKLFQKLEKLQGLLYYVYSIKSLINSFKILYPNF